MEKTVTKTARSVEEAISLAIEELGVSEEDAVIEVVEDGSAKGVLKIGKKSSTARVTAEIPERVETEAEEDTTYYGDDETYEGDALSQAEEDAVNFVAEILSGIGIHGKLDSYREEDTIYISVTGQDCGAAIGRHGETLDAISYLTSLVANKNSEEHLRVSLDIGGYKKRREAIVISLANKAATRALHTGEPVAMEAMNPSERRIVHFALQSIGGVSTHSEGEEPERRVIVSPAGEERPEV